MKASELARQLTDIPNDPEVVQKVGQDWIEVFGVQPTGEHRNAITFSVAMPGLPGDRPGVIVVPGDM